MASEPPPRIVLEVFIHVADGECLETDRRFMELNCSLVPSELLRLVAHGETVEITDRGRPVALLTPLPDGSPLERMRSTGEVEPATEDLEDLPEPLVLDAGIEPPSEALARLRRGER